jgi:hypothetical protein
MLRVEAARVQSVGAKALEAYRATPEYVAWESLVDQQGSLASAIGALERKVHESTLAAFRETGEKAPTPGVSVKLYRQIRYDSAAALRWAKANMPVLIREVLDVKAFERAASAIDEATSGCWRIEYDPRPQIAGDLSAYLPAEEAEK